MADAALDGYDAEHIREQLIADPRVSALDLQVRLMGDALVVTGNVGSPEQREAVAALVAELAPGVDIRNDLSVTDMSEPTGQEVIS